MRSYVTSLVFFLLIVLFLPLSAIAQNKIPHDVMGSGGGESSGGGYYLNCTIGQPAIGVITGSSNTNKIGYWYIVDALHIGPTSEVVLSAFHVDVVNEGVVLTWEVGEGSTLIGFNVYRSLERDGDFERLNEELIPRGKRSYLDESALPGVTYYYRVGAKDEDGEFFSPIGRVNVPPRETTLYQNYPNPFNPLTTISFYIPRPEKVSLVIYDAQGKLVKTLASRRMDFGKHEITWNGTNKRGESVGSGIYFYRLKAGKKVITKKLSLIK